MRCPREVVYAGEGKKRYRPHVTKQFIHPFSSLFQDLPSQEQDEKKQEQELEESSMLASKTISGRLYVRGKDLLEAAGTK